MGAKDMDACSLLDRIVDEYRRLMTVSQVVASEMLQPGCAGIFRSDGRVAHTPDSSRPNPESVPS